MPRAKAGIAADAAGRHTAPIHSMRIAVMILVPLRSFTLVLASALLLAGCSLPGWRRPWDTGATPAPPPPVADSQAREPPIPKARPAEPKLAARPPAEKPKPPGLVGLSEAETVDLLGRPSEETDQAPGKLWLYRSGGCELSVHLFPDMDRGGFYALDYGVMGQGDGRDACLARTAEEARRQRD